MKSRRFFLLSVLAAVMCLATACGGTVLTQAPPFSELESKRNVDKLNDSIMILAAGRQDTFPEFYRVGPEDQLEIGSDNLEELRRTVVVDAHGDIDLPLAGRIHVDGLTTGAIVRKLTESVSSYVQHTEITVAVKEYRSRRITIVGAVKTPKSVAVMGRRSLVDALMAAEGLSPEAGTTCYIIRPASHGAGTGAETIIVDLNDLLLGGNTSLDLPLRAGDIVNVPRAGVFFIDGEVGAPGIYSLSGKMTLTQAVFTARGLKSGAKKGDIRIYRDNGRGERTEIDVDYSDIIEGKKSDVVLANNDIVIVPKAGVRSLIDGFVNIVRGVVSLGSYTVMPGGTIVR